MSSGLRDMVTALFDEMEGKKRKQQKPIILLKLKYGLVTLLLAPDMIPHTGTCNLINILLLLLLLLSGIDKGRVSPQRCSSLSFPTTPPVAKVWYLSPLHGSSALEQLLVVSWVLQWLLV